MVEDVEQQPFLVGEIDRADLQLQLCVGLQGIGGEAEDQLQIAPHVGVKARVLWMRERRVHDRLHGRFEAGLRGRIGELVPLPPAHAATRQLAQRVFEELEIHACVLLAALLCRRPDIGQHRLDGGTQPGVQVVAERRGHQRQQPIGVHVPETA